jgi:hypothetical protein
MEPAHVQPVQTVRRVVNRVEPPHGRELVERPVQPISGEVGS